MLEIRFAIALRARKVVVPAGCLGLQNCPACGASLAIHQPDIGDPDRLLACCPGEACGSWFAIVRGHDGRSFFAVRLPSAADLGRVIAQHEDGDGAGKIDEADL